MKIIKYFNLVLCLLVLGAVSCSKNEDIIRTDENGNKIVKVSKVGYNFNKVNINLKSENDRFEGNTVSSAYAEINEDFVLVAELKEIGSIDTKATTYELLTKGVKPVTIYSNTTMTPKADDPLITAGSEFLVPQESNSVLHFFAYGDKDMGESFTYKSDERSFEFTSSSKRLYAKKVLASEITTSPYELILTPMFSEIASLTVNASNTSGTAEWPITGIGAIKVISGYQDTHGAVAVTSSGNSYQYVAPATTEAVLRTPQIAPGQTISFNGSLGSFFVPVGEGAPADKQNLKLQATVYLQGKTDGNTLTVDLGQLKMGTKYTINLSVKHSGIKVKFYANANMYGLYTPQFDNAQQVALGANDGEVKYYKYGEVVTLPTAPKRTSAVDFNPEHVLRFDGWYPNKACTESEKFGTTITLNETNFASLKTSDEVNVYAYFNPIWYYYDTDTPTYRGGTARSYTEYLPGTIGTEVALKSTRFKKLPTRDDLQKYFKSVIFRDYGYTDDKQDGYWFCKWNKIDSYAGQTPTTKRLDNANFSEIDGGIFKKEDFFFVPAFGSKDGNRQGEIGELGLAHTGAMYAKKVGAAWDVSSGGTPENVILQIGWIYGACEIVMYPQSTNYLYPIDYPFSCYWPDSTYPTGGVFGE